ncbi:MAG: NAD-glutamate dehydrogenase, partial [Actinomycetota bacterium]|nr:NAD-glutamate dehydrogenase [Actinomycetota bacterium]
MSCAGVTRLSSAARPSAARICSVTGIDLAVRGNTPPPAEINDVLRVDGADLRARCVGEGGNLGLTQLGRIEYARGGGR